MFLNQGVCAFMELSYFDDFGQIFSQYFENFEYFAHIFEHQFCE